MADTEIAPPPPPKLSNESDDSPKIPEAPKPVEAKKKGFFSKMFSGKKEEPTIPPPPHLADEVQQKLDEESSITPPADIQSPEDLDLDKIREDFGIATKEEKKTKDEKEEEIVWHEGDVVDEYHKPKEEGPRWDIEEPDHLEEAKPKKSKKKKSKKKKLKSKKKKEKVEEEESPPEKFDSRPEIDKAVEEYFKKVEEEQELIQKELEDLVVHPKKSMSKSQYNYIIHHNEKLIESMKELLAAVNNIEDERFNARVQMNKRAFTSWVEGILEKEKWAEKQRNTLLKKQMKDMLKTYGKGIQKDIQDKKYELSQQKKEADSVLKMAEKQQKSVDEREAAVKAKEKEVNDLIESGIEKQLEKSLTKERSAMLKAENTAQKMFSDYTTEYEKYKVEKAAFDKARREAKDLINSSMQLRREKKALEKQREDLQNTIADLERREGDLSARMTELEAKDQSISEKDDQLARDIQSMEDKGSKLQQQEMEVTMKIQDLENRKKEFETREHEIQEMESLMQSERRDLRSIKDDLEHREELVRSEFNKAKGFRDEVFEMEAHRREHFKDDLDDFEFGSRISGVREPDEIPDEVKEFQNLIEECRRMVKNNQLNDAKRSYNQIKERFTNSTVNSDQKESLYNHIRELYDDIYLAALGSS